MSTAQPMTVIQATKSHAQLSYPQNTSAFPSVCLASVTRWLLTFSLLTTTAIWFFPLATAEPAKASTGADTPPSIIIIFADDMGYADLSCYGHPSIQTPNLDQMAAEGMRFTQFYSAACVCTPSRAALLTGRLPIRNGMCSDKRRVLFPDSSGGLLPEEITIADALQDVGYATACVGKWHLGHLPQFLPTNQGFDSYFGIPYSNDMDAAVSAPKGRAKFDIPRSEYFNVPLMQNETIVERPADQTTITRRYTEHAATFIRDTPSEQPLFLYLAHNLPHVPLFRDKAFEGVSRRGLYGDVIAEIDWSVGQILATLKETGRAQNALVFFTSDNGPWLIFNEQGGSAGLLKDGKGGTWEGGMREPAIAWGPGLVKPNTICRELASTLDLLPTCVHLADAKIPTDRLLDGFNLTSLLKTGKGSPRDTMFYYRGTELMAVRQGAWKMHFATQPSYGPGSGVRQRHETPLLYNLEIDPGEQYDVSMANPSVVDQLRATAAAHQTTVIPVPSQLEISATD